MKKLVNGVEVELLPDEEAAVLAAWAAKDARPRPTVNDIDQDTLNAALAAEGSVLRAFALLVLEDRNNMANAVANATSLTDLKVRFPKSITIQQFVALLKAKMRN